MAGHIAPHYQIIFNADMGILAGGVENNDTMACYDTMNLMGIEGFSYC